MVLQTKMSSVCPSCSRTVFAAEEKMAGGFRWHKACFKCCEYDRINPIQGGGGPNRPPCHVFAYTCVYIHIHAPIVLTIPHFD